MFPPVPSSLRGTAGKCHEEPVIRSFWLKRVLSHPKVEDVLGYKLRSALVPT